MASTDTRSGFRLPWVSDAHQAGDPATDNEPVEAVARAGEGDPVDDPNEPIAIAPAADGSAGPADTITADPPLAQVGLRRPDEPAAPAAARRPTKFLADLARAMRSAAESERQEILDRYQAEVKTFIETIHERSAVEATDLRTAADHDIGAIREWSKAEIARIREQTERRVADRRGLLDGEVEAQAARIERQIERVRGTVGAFEAEMTRFFEELLAEEDPSRFAALASNLPEPPSLEAVAASSTALEPAAPLADEPAPEHHAEPATTVDTVGTAVEHVPGRREDERADAIPVDEAAPAPDPAVEAVEAVAEPDAGEPDAGEPEAGEPEAGEPEAGDEPEPAVAPTPPSFDEDSLQLDPRVAALGLTPDFDAAEAEAAEAEAAAALTSEITDDGSGEEVPAMDDETIASRLAGLVPTVPAAADLVETRVVVSGLVSVASIAGFKRGLTRLAGVHSVSVSSGPDGEFVFSVGRSPASDLADAIRTMPGFAARVTAASDDEVEVVAHDPDAT